MIWAAKIYSWDHQPLPATVRARSYFSLLDNLLSIGFHVFLSSNPSFVIGGCFSTEALSIKGFNESFAPGALIHGTLLLLKMLTGAIFGVTVWHVSKS